MDVLVILLLVLGSLRCSYAAQNYQEDLLLRHLPDGRVQAYFNHVTFWGIDPLALATPQKVRHYGMFPRSLAEVVGHYQVQELHLTLTKGKWRTGVWGYPPHSAPPGAEFWVWFLPTTTDIDLQWKGLVNAVSGLMCASLSAIEPSVTYQPSRSFKPEGAILGNLSAALLRYAALPREAVCTENLTPWSKLLPCGQKAGLASLYVALKLYEANYHSLEMHLVPVCKDTGCSNVGIELRQALSVVFLPRKSGGLIQWSLQSLFTKEVSSPCALADNSSIYVDTTSNIPVGLFNLSPPPARVEHATFLGLEANLAVYDTINTTGVDITFEWTTVHAHKMPQAPLVDIQRYVTGSGHERGSIRTSINNRSPSMPGHQAILLEMVPWYFRILLHTLHVSCVQYDKDGMLSDCHEEVVVSRNYTPGRDRQRPHTHEMMLNLPPLSTVTISVEFSRGFLKWTEHPPDAHHGFYINSAVLTTVLDFCPNCSITPSLLHSSADHSAVILRLHSEPLLVSLPTPDFSMPYNVICFVSTVIAIAFGSLFNLSTKTLLPIPEKQPPGLLSRLTGLFRRKESHSQ